MISKQMREREARKVRYNLAMLGFRAVAEESDVLRSKALKHRQESAASNMVANMNYSQQKLFFAVSVGFVFIAFVLAFVVVLCDVALINLLKGKRRRKDQKMSNTGLHYHFATGKSSVNRGKFYKCSNKRTSPQDACCIIPAYRDAEGKQEILC
jgi:hypothetical protein